MNKTISNTVNLFEAVDKLFDTISSNNYQITTTDSSGNWNFYQPSYTDDYYGWYDFKPYWSEIIIPTISTPSYPVANGWFLSNGDLLLEIAVTGFEKEEIKIKREDYKLVIEGNPKKTDISDRKELFHTLAKRSFTLKYSIPSKMDLDNIDVTMDKGILTIKVPIKDEMRPVVKEITIK